MHKDLKDCIRTAQQARDGVLARTMSVKEANSVAANNHTVVISHAIDLRERMFLAALPDRNAGILGPPTDGR